MNQPTPTPSHAVQPDVIRYFPLPLFASIMGLSGLALVWLKAAHLWHWPAGVGQAITVATTALFLLYGLLLLLKAARNPQAIREDWRHPVRLNFFAAITISLLLLGTAYQSFAPGIGHGFWLLGAIGHALLVPMIMHTWLHHTNYQVTHINPAWFIPVVGNVVAPLAGVGYGHLEASWYFFAVGIVFWLVLLTIVVHRLIFFEPLPQRLAPTLFILLAPPSVGMLAWLKLDGETLDATARILYGVALFLALVLATNAVRFVKVPFFLSAWAYSFPLAALTVATMTMAHLTANSGLHTLAVALMVLTTAVILWLVVKTAIAAAKRAIFLPE
ncbi:SLAC1 anion channel family protein [Hydrogenophilus thiooxidans]|uniref:SLAC1 anion channel family protein n=1 Tax=Hydrogenophilus thiooxidans TaxID=2820326 RepID=UPI001C220AF1|nr:SLAC1 anion channel family protein [Hydrogenophilus thiooxidans]